MKLNKNLTRILLMLFSVFILVGSVSSQNRARISRQLQQSVSAYSIVVTDASNNQAYIVPGAESTVLSIVGGIPTWSAPGGGGTLTDNGVSLSGVTVQLGHAATGTGAADFTANRYQFLGNFDYEIGSTGDANAFYVDGSTGNIGVGGIPSEIFHVAKQTTFTTAQLLVEHTDNGAGSTAQIRVKVAGTSAGEASLQIEKSGTQTWSIGFDDGVSDNLEFSASSNMASPRFMIEPAGQIHFNDYGSGNFTTGLPATFNTMTDINGEIIETHNPVESNVFEWQFDGASTADSDPGAGEFRFNNAAGSLTTFIFVDDLSTDGLDIADFVDNLADGNHVFVQEKGKQTSAFEFTVNGSVTVATGYLKIPVTFVSEISTEITDNQLSVFKFPDVGNVSGSGDNIYNIDGTLTASRTLDMSTSTFDLLIGDIVAGDEMSLDIIQAGQIEMRYLKGTINSEIGILSAGATGDIYINLQDAAKDNNMTFTDTSWDHDMDDGVDNSIAVTFSTAAPSASWVLTDGATVNTFTINEDRTAFGGQWAQTGKISATLTASQNNWSPAGLAAASFIRIDGDAAYNITGISTASWTDGTRVVICNFDSADDFTFMHEDVLSTAGNRFDLKSDADYILLDGSCIELIYDQTSSRIRIVE